MTQIKKVERKRQQVYSKLVVSLVFLVLAKCDLQQRQVGELRNSLTEQQENIIHLQQSLDSQTNRLLEYYEALNTASPSNLYHFFSLRISTIQQKCGVEVM